MAAHPRPAPSRCTGGPAATGPDAGTELLKGLDWLLLIFGLFCLVGAAVVLMVSTPAAWPY